MLSVSNVSKYLGGRFLYKDASFQIHPGEKIGLVGPNGAGKSTFFKMIVGEERPDQGNIIIQNGVSLAYFSQNVGEMKGRTCLEEVILGNERVSYLAKELDILNEKLCNPDLDPDEMDKILDRMGDYQTEFEKLGGYDIEINAKEILTGLGIAPVDHDKQVEDFSGGWKMRIALAKVMILLPDLILMDEPTNYLDMETIIWLEQWLKNFEGAILMTTHDRDFMNRVVNKIVEVANGRITSFSGNYDFYQEEKEIRKKQNEAEYDRQQSKLKKEEEFIARFKARASHAAQVQSRVKMLDKIDRVELELDDDEISIELPEIPRGGNDVVVIENLAKAWKNSDGSDNLVFSALTAIVNRLDKIAVTGINGAGKSSFLKVLCGMTEASQGSAKLGPSIDCGYFGQITVEQLNGNYTVMEEFQSQHPEADDATARNILASFLFRGDDVYKQIKYLSGGEKARVILSFLLTRGHNFLILDEPTNHLDIRSREVLLDALKRYQGTVMIVSHDRFFLRELTNRVFEVDRGQINIYEGDYQYYLDKKSGILK